MFVIIGYNWGKPPGIANSTQHICLYHYTLKLVIDQVCKSQAVKNLNCNYEIHICLAKAYRLVYFLMLSVAFHELNFCSVVARVRRVY